MSHLGEETVKLCESSSLLLIQSPPYQLVWGTEQVVGWIPHQVDT